MLGMTKKKTKAAVPISGQIRQLIDTCGVTRYRLSKETGLSQSLLSKFMNVPGYTLSLDSIDALGACLGWRIVADSPRAGTAGTTGHNDKTQARGRGKGRGRKGK
jgi:hypothetical protein